MNDMTMSTEGVSIADPIIKPKSRAERVTDWKKSVQAEYKTAHAACCTCTPTRAQMLLVQQYEGDMHPPID